MTRISSAVGRWLLAALLAWLPAAHAEEPVIRVVKSPSCGCCEAWIGHLRAAGYTVESRDATNLAAVRSQLGVPRKLAGCHTATVGGYVIEGHVPAAQVKRLLRDKPQVVGIAVPGMPVGSPGMEGPGGHPYEVLSWRKDGSIDVVSVEQPHDR